jgi:hypothetical protein
MGSSRVPACVAHKRTLAAWKWEREREKTLKNQRNVIFSRNKQVSVSANFESLNSFQHCHDSHCIREIIGREIEIIDLIDKKKK